MLCNLGQCCSCARPNNRWFQTDLLRSSVKGVRACWMSSFLPAAVDTTSVGRHAFERSLTTLVSSRCAKSLMMTLTLVHLQTHVDNALVRVIDSKPDGYILCNPHLEGWCATARFPPQRLTCKSSSLGPLHGGRGANHDPPCPVTSSCRGKATQASLCTFAKWVGTWLQAGLVRERRVEGRNRWGMASGWHHVVSCLVESPLCSHLHIQPRPNALRSHAPCEHSKLSCCVLAGSHTTPCAVTTARCGVCCRLPT